jgi:hypothetical protein
MARLAARPGPVLKMRIFWAFRDREQASTFNLLNHVVKKFMIHNVRILTKVTSTILPPRCAFNCDFCVLWANCGIN